MTNREKWLKYTEGLPSPQSYCEWSYRYLISACLQRRVWMPPSHRPCYPNMYAIMVGRPGIGKGQIIKSVEEVLRHHRMDGLVGENSAAQTEDEKQVVARIAERDLKAAQELESSGKNTSEKPLLVPMAANATTYEALVQHMARCIRSIEHRQVDAQGKSNLKIYTHSSLCFCLEELGSLLRSNKNTKDVIQFLLETYDCNDNYEYATKTQGKDRIRRVCLNLLAGTTPDFMQATFDDGLLNQGYASRSFFIYAAKNRKSVFFIPQLTQEQISYRDEITKYVKGLLSLYGEIRIDPSTETFLQDWWAAYEPDTTKRASQSRKLDAYYARKNIHVMKVAMALHFGESYEMHIPLETFKMAIDILHEEEKTMHKALLMEADNPLATATEQIIAYLRVAGRKTFNELLVEFWNKVRKTELEEVLNFLQSTGQVVARQLKDEQTQITDMYYQLKDV